MRLSTATTIGIVIWAASAQVPSFAGESQPLLGIKVKALRTFQASAIAKSDYPQESGVLISYVYPDGPAEEASLEEYDIIASSGDTQFETAGDFIEWLKTTSDGKRYPLMIWRREDEEWVQRQIFYRAEWGIRDAPIAHGAAWDGPLSPQVAEPVVYISSKEKSTLWSDGTEFVTVQYEGHAPVEGFYNVEGVPTRVSMKSSDEKVLKVSYAELTHRSRGPRVLIPRWNRISLSHARYGHHLRCPAARTRQRRRRSVRTRSTAVGIGEAQAPTDREVYPSRTPNGLPNARGACDQWHRSRWRNA